MGLASGRGRCSDSGLSMASYWVVWDSIQSGFFLLERGLGTLAEEVGERFGGRCGKHSGRD